MPSLGGEVSCRSHVTRFYVILKHILSINKLISFASFPALILHYCWYDYQRVVVYESGVFPRRYHSTMVFHAHILPGGWTIDPLIAAVKRRILIPSI
jgi:hypothetical protein